MYSSLEVPRLQQQHHSPKRSSGILRSIMPGENRRVDYSKGKSEPSAALSRHLSQTVPLLPPDHPHTQSHQLDEERRGRSTKKENVAPQKRSKSTVSLRSLGRSKTQDDTAEKERKSRKEKKTRDADDEARKKPKKTKSSTSLAGMFARMNRSTKDLSQVPNDKENMAPAAPTLEIVKGPVSTGDFRPRMAEQQQTNQHPLRTRSETQPCLVQVQKEIDRYTPNVYLPSNQRDFAAYGQPMLSRPKPAKRPKSALVTGTSNFMEALSHTISGDRSQVHSRDNGPLDVSQYNAESTTRPSLEHVKRAETDPVQRKVSSSSNEMGPPQQNLTIGKRGVRVMAAVAALNGKAQMSSASAERTVIDPKTVDAAFEAVLDARNIPENMRPKMRALTLRVKTDFIKSEKITATPSSPDKADPKSLPWSDNVTPRQSSQEVPSVTDSTSDTSQRTRPRSKTFTSTKTESSPAKGQKPESRPTSIIVPKGTSIVKALASPSIGCKPALPEDFVAYLREVRNPTKLELGRLHKLRLLLRNETVAWVNSFISQGGMSEIEDLLYRIMEVEWREEHEDQLLHETLLCLKGLCTTEIALERLEEIADTLFPKVLAMLFDEEKKGPSEFNTRAIIINVLFAHLSHASTISPENLSLRARKVLSYLAGPQKTEDALPIHFVLDMRQSRPYRTWCTEVSNVSREIFWIFLHHLNIVPLSSPDQDELSTALSAESHDTPTEAQTCASSVRGASGSLSLAQSYTKRHFPGARPPVPAAPYIGGVEWDATTYLTAHLDLLNGLIASLLTKEERNVLRQELKASGWEKLMGSTLRTCKEKFYSGVHSALQSWVAAALEDGWDIAYVRYGPSKEERAAASPKKSPKKSEPPPQLGAADMQLPKLDLNFEGLNSEKGAQAAPADDGWLM